VVGAAEAEAAGVRSLAVEGPSISSRIRSCEDGCRPFGCLSVVPRLLSVRLLSVRLPVCPSAGLRRKNDQGLAIFGRVRGGVVAVETGGG